MSTFCTLVHILALFSLPSPHSSLASFFLLLFHLHLLYVYNLKYCMYLLFFYTV